METAQVKQEPVVDSVKDGYSSISIEFYVNTTGVCMRSLRDQKLIGYCVENPLQVLEKVFPTYHVTTVNGYRLFDSGNFESSTPMIGLGINKIEPVFGIEGKIDNLIKSDDFLKVKRELEISNKDIQQIINYLGTNPDPSLAFFYPEHNQSKFGKQQVSDIIKKYLK